MTNAEKREKAIIEKIEEARNYKADPINGVVDTMLAEAITLFQQPDCETCKGSGKVSTCCKKELEISLDGWRCVGCGKYCKDGMDFLLCPDCKGTGKQPDKLEFGEDDAPEAPTCSPSAGELIEKLTGDEKEQIKAAMEYRDKIIAEQAEQIKQMDKHIVKQEIELGCCKDRFKAENMLKENTLLRREYNDVVAHWQKLEAHNSSLVAKNTKQAAQIKGLKKEVGDLRAKSIRGGLKNKGSFTGKCHY